MAKIQEEPPAGIPGWLVSFGDMMTLILTFFILLVSMAKERNYGLMASGLGSFMLALKSHGLPGVVTESERIEVFEHYRRRFNLPPEPDPARREAHLDASDLELVKAAAAESLQPHDELTQPMVASFEADSAVLTDASRAYLDRLADTLRPGSGQVLILEGHARDAGPNHAGDDQWLAFRRAQTVSQWLIEEHGFPARRVEARAWLREVDPSDAATRTVDARLITPTKKND